MHIAKHLRYRSRQFATFRHPPCLTFTLASSAKNVTMPMRLLYLARVQFLPGYVGAPDRVTSWKQVCSHEEKNAKIIGGRTSVWQRLLRLAPPKPHRCCRPIGIIVRARTNTAALSILDQTTAPYRNKVPATVPVYRKIIYCRANIPATVKWMFVLYFIYRCWNGVRMRMTFDFSSVLIEVVNTVSFCRYRTLMRGVNDQNAPFCTSHKSFYGLWNENRFICVNVWRVQEVLTFFQGSNNRIWMIILF